MRKLLCAGLWILGTTLAFAAEPARSGTTPHVMVVVGAPGEPAYLEDFKAVVQRWQEACRSAGTEPLILGLDSAATNDLDRLKTALHDQLTVEHPALWLILIGHGTFDGKEAKFNLRGPDLSATQLAEWLEPCKRPLAVINTTSASAPFLKKLSRHGRVIITATRSGYEQNYARFAQFFSAAVSDLTADLDKDGQVSLLEAFLMAAHDVAEFYKTEGRLATEHPLIDDNGDGFGTPPDWFRGVRAVKRAADGAELDGLRAHQLHLIPSPSERTLSPELVERRNALEIQLEELRAKKAEFSEDEYYNRLEALLLKLARIYEPAPVASTGR